jgi:hypothetical protein
MKRTQISDTPNNDFTLLFRFIKGLSYIVHRNLQALPLMDLPLTHIYTPLRNRTTNARENNVLYNITHWFLRHTNVCKPCL